MFRFLWHKLQFLATRNTNEQGRKSDGKSSSGPLNTRLSENLSTIKKMFSGSSDFIVREFYLGGESGIPCAFIYIDGLVDTSVVSDQILRSLMSDIRQGPSHERAVTDIIIEIKNRRLTIGGITEAETPDELVMGCLDGNGGLLVDGCKQALVIECKGWEQRAVEEPKTESVIRGPREGFTENLRVNTSMLRRKVKNGNLVLDTLKLGRQTKTAICVAYLKNIADPALIEKIKYRLGLIQTDAILESGYVEQYIEDAPYSIFTTVGYSEKPDVVAAKLLEGRAAIFVDGTPFVLTAPMYFMEGFQASEDYYFRPYFVSMLRIFRAIAFALSILAPALYVALTTFHQELIPTPLLFTMAAATEGVPFPAVLEAAVMLIVFEILKEAGVRLPRPIGQAISIVGALVMGESAVSAGLIGAPMVIVVAIMAVSSFVVPFHANAGSIIRFILLILSGIMGGFGIAMGLLFIMIHLASLKSFGLPYMAPFAPLRTSDLKDTFVRFPWPWMILRPKGLSKDNPQRQQMKNEPSGKGG